MTFALEHLGGAVLLVRHGVRDPLPEDNVAAVVLPPSVLPRGPHGTYATCAATSGARCDF